MKAKIKTTQRIELSLAVDYRFGYTTAFSVLYDAGTKAPSIWRDQKN